MRESLITLHDMVESLSLASDFQENLEILLDHSILLKAVDLGAIYCVDRITGDLRLAGSRGLLPGTEERIAAIQASTKLAELIFSGESLLIDHTDTNRDNIKQIFLLDNIRTVLVIPVKNGDEIIAGMIFGSYSDEPITENDTILLQTVAAILKNVIVKNMIEEDLKQMKVFGKLHSEMSTRLIGIEPEKLDGSINSALKRIGEITAVDKARIFVQDADNSYLTLKYEWDSSKPDSDPNECNPNRIPLDPESFLQNELFTGKPLLVPDINELPYVTDFEIGLFQKDKTHTLAVIPLNYCGNTLGCFCLTSSKKQNWPRGFMEILKLIGDVFINALEHKRKEEELKNSERKYKTIFENIDDVYFETNIDGKIITISPSVKRHLGYEPEEMVDFSSLYLYKRPEDRDDFIQCLKDSGSINDHLIELKKKDGMTICGSISAYTVCRPDGTPEKIVGVARDITEKKRIEKMLIEAKLLFENAHHVQREFVSTINHELRTPLNIIMGFSDVILNDPTEPLSEKQRKYIMNIKTAGLKLFDLITSLIHISEIEDGKIELDIKEFSLPLLISDIQKMTYPMAGKKTIELTFNVDSHIEYIHADELKLKLILLNLINNAIKFTPDYGNVTVSVTKKADKYLHFIVTDTGVGIPEEEQGKLFRPFVQLESALTRKEEGAGLGLALVKEFVEMQGGKIWLQSETGKGSTFEFTIFDCPCEKRTLAA